MATVNKFEELVCWQRARELTREIYLMFKSLKFKDYGLQDQLQRASVSIMSNIAEGFEQGTKFEFLNYLYIAKGSAGEVRAQLCAALDAGYLDFETFKRLNGLAQECSKLISNFIQSLKVSKFQGLQYKPEKKKDTRYSDMLKEHGLVWTAQGVVKREEAEEKGLEIIER